jgi:branched-chain amino acid aminotransferase
MRATKKALENGCKEVLWLDAKEHKYVEEVGTSNAFFMINDEVITAPLAGSILPGVTRDSTITLLKKWGYKVSERRLAIADVEKASQDGSLQEAWATGTACVISPIGYLKYMGRDIKVQDGGVGALSQRLYDTLYGIQTGTREDDMGWTVQI